VVVFCVVFLVYYLFGMTLLIMIMIRIMIMVCFINRSNQGIQDEKCEETTQDR